MVRITWLAHACFVLENDAGTRLLMDPYDESTGYEVRKTRANMVTTSHKHGDHANLAMAEGDYALFDKPGRFEKGGFKITGISSWHDDCGGKKRGQNAIFVAETEGIRICHLGDLGHLLSREQIGGIGRVDILLIPVGGTYTIDAETAVEVAESLKPLAVIPMHYKTEFCPYPIESEQRFLELMQQKEYAVIMHHASTREYASGDLPRRRAVVVLDHMY